MHPHDPQTLPRQRKFFAPLTILALLIALCGVVIVSSIAQSEKKEREIEEKIPTHLPIKVKIKKPEKVKDLKNEDWLSDLEVEVINTGTKPIYYLYINLSLPDVVDDDGINYGFILRYGRVELVDLTERLLPDDVPILPKESAVLKVAPIWVEGWKASRREGRRSNPKKFVLRFQLLNFGDGTGFMGPTGVPLPRNTGHNPPRSCREGDIQSERTAIDSSLIGRFPEIASLNPVLHLPANFLPANFFLREKVFRG